MIARRLTEETRSPRKISRGEWGTIAARYDAGESLATIGRSYNCTAPAIRYILHQHARANGTVPGPSEGGRPRSRRRALTVTREHPPQITTVAEAGLATPLTSTLEPRPAPRVAPTSFDPSLRDRITVEVSVFLVAFETVLATSTDQDLDRLREATDRLMRAAARVRIELDRVRRA
jgi:hypothetical protein